MAMATALAVVMRLPMLGQPLTSDEGGYAGVASGWAHGERLYRDVWVDRPQGLLVLYRLIDWLDGGHAVGIRLTAIVFGVGLVWATALAVRGLAGDGAGAVAAIACAAVTSVPVLEGFAANGELLAGACAAAAIAMVVDARRNDRWWRWCVAGVVGGVAISLKQSGFDGLVAIGIWLVVLACFGPGRVRAARRLGLVVAGSLLPLGALAVDGAVIGWHRWMFAMGLYRMRTQSAVSDADWFNLEHTARIAGPVLGLVALAALAGIVVAPRVVREGRAWVLPIAWLLAAVAAFLAGGGFWRHYWVQLGAPLSALAGIAVARIAPRWRTVAAGALVLPALVAAIWVVDAPRDRWMVRAIDDPRLPADARVARWMRANGVHGEHLYVMCASAGLYGDADAVPAYPYLWMTEVHDAPGAPARLRAYLADPVRGPTYVAEFQPAWDCDASGGVQRVLDADYERVATVDSIDILRRRSSG